ncbi:MAG: hypothetical protein QM743_10135 [Chitinophagaceae bacterium]
MKYIITLSLCCLLHFSSFAAFFSLSAFRTKIAASDRFSRVTVIDRRADTGRVIGKVKLDATVGPEDLLSERTLHEELESWYLQNGKRQESETALVVILYAFEAKELPADPLENRESATFTYSADFFSTVNGSTYRLLASVDTVCSITAFNVTDPLYEMVNRVLAASYRVMRKFPAVSDRQYTYAEVQSHQQNSYKSFLPFNGGTLPDQAYFEDWNDFRAMRGATDKTFVKKSDYVTVYRIRKDRKNIMTNATGQVLIYEGTPYYRMNATYREMILKDGEYRIKSPVYVAHFAPNLAYGLVGAVIAPKQKVYVQEPYECRIDSRTGRVIPVNELGKDDDLGRSLGISRMAGFTN